MESFDIDENKTIYVMKSGTYKKVATLGEGAFGKVLKVQKVSPENQKSGQKGPKYFALKVSKRFKKKKKSKKASKVTGDEGFLKPTERGKRSSMARFIRDSDNVGGFDYDDYSKCREIIFKIKLNPEEYKILLKEKKNKGKLSPYLFK